MSGHSRNAEEAVFGFADNRQIQSREFSRGWRTILLLFTRGQERRRAAAVQDAGAFSGDDRISRSVVECASPLALWQAGMQVTT